MLFNKAARARIDLLERGAAALMAVNKELEARLEATIKVNEQLATRAFLIDITRAARVNKFLFVRNGELIEIETMGLISDDVEGWKERLLK